MSDRRASRQKERKKTKASKNDRRGFNPSIRGKDSIDTKLNILIMLFIGTNIVIGFFTVSALTNNPFSYAGGWEAQGSMTQFVVEGENKANTIMTGNLHVANHDTDGDFQSAYVMAASAADVTPGNYDDPDVLSKVGYPFYLEQISSGWVESDDPVIIDIYERDYTKADGTQVHIEYIEYAIGMSVQMQTAAEKYFKPQFIPFIQDGYLDYGYYYEDNAVDLTVRSTIALSPWTPSGVYDGWSLTGGWAGIMSVSVYEVEYGLADTGAVENKGHILQGLMSEGQALNMYIPNTDTAEDDSDFSDFEDAPDPTAITGVPTAVDFDVQATLGAGAFYQTDLLGHWTDVAVRNVFVNYNVKASFVSTLVYELAAGSEGEIEPPPENNTVYAAEITPFNDFLNYMEGLFPGFQNILIILVVGIFGILFIVVLVKFAR